MVMRSAFRSDEEKKRIGSTPPPPPAAGAGRVGAAAGAKPTVVAEAIGRRGETGREIESGRESGASGFNPAGLYSQCQGSMVYGVKPNRAALQTNHRYDGLRRSC